MWKSKGGGLMPPEVSSWDLFPRVWGVEGVTSSFAET